MTIGMHVWSVGCLQTSDSDALWRNGSDAGLHEKEIGECHPSTGHEGPEGE